MRKASGGVGRGVVSSGSMLAVALGACAPHYFELPAAQRADVTPEVVTAAFVMATPKGNWVAEGTAGCERPSFCDREWREALNTLGVVVADIIYCNVDAWTIETDEAPTHVYWGLSALALELAPDSLIVADSLRASRAVASLTAALRSKPFHDWDELKTSTLKTRGETYQLIEMKYGDALWPFSDSATWAALMVRGTMVYVVITAARPKPHNTEFEVLSSLQPLP